MLNLTPATIQRQLNALIDTIFDDQATVHQLLALVAAIGVFWAIFFYLFAEIVRPLVYNKPWLIAAGNRDYDRGGKELNESLGLSKTREQFLETFMDMWPWNQAVFLQHAVGGMLCLPSLLGLGDEKMASSLACLGILAEMGWEIEDLTVWMYKRFALPDGKTKVPNALLIVLAIHHSLTTILGMPMVLAYRDLKVLHWLCFDLQCAGECRSSSRRRPGDRPRTEEQVAGVEEDGKWMICRLVCVLWPFQPTRLPHRQYLERGLSLKTACSPRP